MDWLPYFTQQLIDGITRGSVYGMVAIGYTMVYGIIGMVNFAHGDVFMIGAFHALIGFLILAALGFSTSPIMVLVQILIVLFIAVTFTSVYGWAVERIAYRPLRGSSRLAPLISAIGMSVVLQNFVLLVQGSKPKPLPQLITGREIIPLAGGTVSVSYVQILVVASTVVFMLIFAAIIARTPLGRAQRACEQDMKMVRLLGINVDRVISLTFVMGAALAGVAGLMVTLIYGSVNFYMGFVAGIKAFSAAVLGGIGSLPGAMLGGILIGIIEAMWSAYFKTEYQDVAAFAVLVLVLIFRPTGLLGRPEIEKV